MMIDPSRSGPEPRVLSAETVATLRAAVLRVWTDAAEPDDALRAAIARGAAEARERSQPAEALVIDFKAVLDGLPESPQKARRFEQDHLRARLVSLCIKAYYQE